MKLNKNNLIARYYQWIYGNLPIDVCSLFWGSLFAIGLFFLLVPGRFLLSKDDKNVVPAQLSMGIVAWLVYAISIMAGVAIITPFGYEFTNLWGYLLLGALIGAGVIGAVVFLFFGAIYVSVEKLPETTVAQNTRDFVGAIRRKHCTKINWK